MDELFDDIDNIKNETVESQNELQQMMLQSPPPWSDLQKVEFEKINDVLGRKQIQWQEEFKRIKTRVDRFNNQDPLKESSRQKLREFKNNVENRRIQRQLEFQTLKVQKLLLLERKSFDYGRGSFDGSSDDRSTQISTEDILKKMKEMDLETETAPPPRTNFPPRSHMGNSLPNKKNIGKKPENEMWKKTCSSCGTDNHPSSKCNQYPNKTVFATTNGVKNDLSKTKPGVASSKKSGKKKVNTKEEKSKCSSNSIDKSTATIANEAKSAATQLSSSQRSSQQSTSGGLVDGNANAITSLVALTVDIPN